MSVSTFYYLIKYAEDNGIDDMNGEILLICIAISSSIARLLCGKMSDLPGMNSILLGQISYMALGVSIMMFSCCIYFDQYIFHIFILCSLTFGFFEGCCLTMIVPTALKLCGPIGATQGIAFMFGLVSIPVTIGPPIAGFIFDQTTNYAVCFLAAGVPPIVSALMMSFIYVANRGNQIGQEGERHDGNRERRSSKYGHRPIFSIRITHNESEIRGISWTDLNLKNNI